MNDRAAPPWLDPCPSWCTRVHDPADHPDDRRHQGAEQILALDLAPEPLPGDGEPSAVDVVVHADRPTGSDQDWLRIESAESSRVRLALTPMSARALIRALHRVLEEISP